MRRAWIGSLLLVVGVALVPAEAATAARAPDWTRRLDRVEVEATVLAPDGGLYVVGTKHLGGYRHWAAAYLARFGPEGRLIWRRVWNPRDRRADFTAATEVAIGGDGSVYWAGGAHGRCEGGGWFLRRTAPDGRLLWHREQAGWRECQVATAVTDVSVGDRLVAMSIFDHGCCGDPFADGYALAFGLDGTSWWQAPFEPPGLPSGRFDRATGIAVGGFDNVYVTGWGATGPIGSDDPMPYPGIAALVKVDAGGSVLWTRRIPVEGRADWPADVAVRGSAVMVTGDSGGIGISWDWRPPASWLARLTPGGDVTWMRTWGHHERGAAAVAVAIDPGGGTWVVGTTRDPGDRALDLFVRRYAPAGRLTTAWTQEGHRYLMGRDVAVSSDALAIVAQAEDRQQDRAWGLVYRWDR